MHLPDITMKRLQFYPAGFKGSGNNETYVEKEFKVSNGPSKTHQNTSIPAKIVEYSSVDGNDDDKSSW